MRVRSFDRSLFADLIARRNERRGADAGGVPVRISMDAIDISTEGRGLAGKLRISAAGTMGAPERLKDPHMRRMDRALGEVDVLLEEMRTISRQAEKTDLADDERAGLQLRMTHLQAELYRKTYGMSRDLARTSPQRGKTVGDDALKAVAQEEEKTTDFVKLWGGTARDGEDGLLYGVAESGLPITPGARMERNGMNLLSAADAAESTRKIDRQIEKLERLQKRFDALAADNPTATMDESTIRTPEAGQLATRLGVMEMASATRPEADPYDIRLATTNGKVGAFFQELDAFFKDDVYAVLGYGDMWREETGESPDTAVQAQRGMAAFAALLSQDLSSIVCEAEGPSLHPAIVAAREMNELLAGFRGEGKALTEVEPPEDMGRESWSMVLAVGEGAALEYGSRGVMVLGDDFVMTVPEGTSIDDLKGGRLEWTLVDGTMAPNGEPQPGYGMRAAAHRDSTAENPLMLVEAVDESGARRAWVVDINRVDAADATMVEAFALAAYAYPGTGTDAYAGLQRGAALMYDVMQPLDLKDPDMPRAAERRDFLDRADLLAFRIDDDRMLGPAAEN